MLYRLLIIYTTLLIIIAACASCGEIPAPVTYVSPSLRSYVTVFSLEYSRRHRGPAPNLRGINIHMGTIHQPTNFSNELTLGFCQISHDVLGREHREIVIDRTTWDDLEDAQRELVMFHELGHCVLNRDHVDGLHKLAALADTPAETNGLPISIMHPSISATLAPDFWHMPEVRKYYMDELFMTHR